MMCLWSMARPRAGIKSASTGRKRGSPADYVGLSQEVIATAGGGSSSGGSASGGGALFTTNYILSLREGPGEHFNRLDSIPYLTTLNVLGRTADEQWMQVDFNGQTGWVAAWLGNLNTPASLIRVTG